MSEQTHALIRGGYRVEMRNYARISLFGDTRTGLIRLFTVVKDGTPVRHAFAIDRPLAEVLDCECALSHYRNRRPDSHDVCLSERLDECPDRRSLADDIRFLLRYEPPIDVYHYDVA